MNRKHLIQKYLTFSIEDDFRVIMDKSVKIEMEDFVFECNENIEEMPILFKNLKHLKDFHHSNPIDSKLECGNRLLLLNGALVIEASKNGFVITKNSIYPIIIDPFSYSYWLLIHFEYFPHSFMSLLRDSSIFLNSFLKKISDDTSLHVDIYFHYWNCIRICFGKYCIDSTFLCNQSQVIVNDGCNVKHFYQKPIAATKRFFKPIPSFEKITKLFLASRKVHPFKASNSVFNVPLSFACEFLANVVVFLHNLSNFEWACDFCSQRASSITAIEKNQDAMQLSFFVIVTQIRVALSMMSGKWLVSLSSTKKESMEICTFISAFIAKQVIINLIPSVSVDKA